jgi:Trypsin-like peptidase domain/FHA domain
MKVRSRRLTEHMLLAALSMLALLETASAATMEEMQRSTVRIVCKTKTATSTGSGFVVGANQMSYIATNFHVANCATAGEAQALFVFLTLTDGVRLHVLWADKDRDLAILRAARPLGRPAVEFADTSQVVAGAPITVIGFPGAADHVVSDADFAVPSVTRGNISRIVHCGIAAIRCFQHSAATNPGNSGGPVFDDVGNVVGVNSLKALVTGLTLKDGQVSAERMAGVEGIAVAIDTSQLTPQLRTEGIAYATADGTDMNMPLILFATAMIVLAGASGILLALPSGRALLFRRDSWAMMIRNGRKATGLIRVVEGALAGLEVPVQSGVVLGRDPAQAQLVFPENDISVSRRHCDIRFDRSAGLFQVRDLGSRNGTFVVSGDTTPRRLVKDAVERLAPGQNILIGSPRNRLVLDLGR